MIATGYARIQLVASTDHLSDSGDDGDRFVMTQQKKVDRLIKKYDLQGLRDELARQRERGSSYRDVADYVNTRVVQEAIRETPLSIQETMDVLSGEAVSGRATVEIRLEKVGIDIEELEQDLISHTSVRKYIQSELDVDEPEQQESGSYLDFVDWALHRAEVIAERQVKRLDRDERLQEGLSAENIEAEAVIRFYDTSGSKRSLIPIDELVIEEPTGGSNEPDEGNEPPTNTQFRRGDTDEENF